METLKLTNSQRQIMDAMKYFYELRDLKEDGIKKYSYDICLHRAAYKHYFEDNTLQKYLSTHATLYSQWLKEQKP